MCRLLILFVPRDGEVDMTCAANMGENKKRLTTEITRSRV